MKLISVQEASSIIVNNTENFGTEYVSLTNATHRILKENIYADRDFPPFNRVSMDGIALSKTSFDKGQRSFKIENIQAAGSAQLTLKDSANCIEAMTGSILPANTDVVIPYEQISIEQGIATVFTKEVAYFKNIHPLGYDQKKGALLITENTLITAAEIGVLATVGKAMVKVAKQPKIVVISTGDELVAVDKNPEPYQIRKSNVYTVLALLKELNLTAEIVHLNDNQEELTTAIHSLLIQFDVLLFSGGVSKGKFDLLPQVLENLGVQKLFHRVQQRPGKPFWFGKKEGITIFAFPGNPVATFLNFIKYFKPWHFKSAGLPTEPNLFAVLKEDFIFNPDLTYYLQVKVNNINGTLMAQPIEGKGSADLANLLEADGFLELPAEASEFKKGHFFPYFPYRNKF